MSSSASKIQMTDLNDLFQLGNEMGADTERVQQVPLTELYPFKGHPFQVRDDEAMQKTVESIAESGVHVPGIVRPRPEGGYEIIAGHRRKRGCELAGKDTMPVLVRELDDDEATIIMVDSNIQREKILPSEKAFAYKMKLDAMKRQGQRTDLTSAPAGPKSRSNKELAEQSPDGVTQIKRYIRLTNLIPELLNMVDENKIALRPAVELSYLSETEQNVLKDAIESENCTLSHAQAIKLRKFAEDGKLNPAVIDAILSEQKPAPVQVTLKKDRLKQYFPATYSAQQMEEVILSLLESWKTQNTG